MLSFGQSFVFFVCSMGVCCKIIPFSSSINEKYKPLLDAVTAIIQGPFIDYKIMMLTTPDLQLYTSYIGKKMMNPYRDAYMYALPDNLSTDNEITFPPDFVQKSDCLSLVLLNRTTEWLFDENFDYNYAFTLLVSLNESHSEDVLNSDIVKSSRNICLLELSSTGADVNVFTSFPFGNETKFYIGKYGKGVKNVRADLFPERFGDFQGFTVHAASDYDDFPMLLENEDESAGGMNIEILKAIGGWLNFSITTTFEATDQNWGEKINGTYNGLLGMVAYDNYHLTPNYFSLTEDRVKDFDPSTFYDFSGFGFALLIPPPLPRWRNLIFPFNFELWISVLAWLATAPVILVVFNYLNPWKSSNSIFSSIMIVLKSFFRQSIANLPTKSAIRLVLATYWLCGFIITVSYTSNLIAVLTIPAFQKKIDSIYELANSDMRLGMMDYGEFVPEALATSTDNELRKLGEKMDLLSDEDYDVIIEMLFTTLLEGKHAVIDSYAYLRSLVEDNERTNGKAYFLKEKVYTGALVFYFKKKTPWVYRFNIGMERIREAGLGNKWFHDIMQTHKNDQDNNVKLELQPLTLNHMEGAFIGLVLGIGLAFVAFVMELINQKTSSLPANSKEN